MTGSATSDRAVDARAEPRHGALDGTRAGAGDGGFRPDIEGLRGVAVLLVVLFHAGLPVPGGFVGVDIFFVISGFLITGVLLREHLETGRVSLSGFYARRIRRLLPAAAAVLAVTLLAAFAIVGPLDRAGVMEDGAAAALSVANIRFALAEGDYFAAVTAPSPFLHFWSLALEEQFYLVWPAALVLLVRGGRRRVLVALIAILVASFAANVAVTHDSTSWAFYSLPTRAWQLAAGAILAVGWSWITRLPRLPVILAGWIAVVGLVESAFLISPDLPYPGIDAVGPTIFAVLLLASGARPFGPAAVLTLGPLRWLGRISYSLYLWHWPILILPAVALGLEIPVAGRLALVIAATFVAWLSWRFIEEPYRRRRLPGASPRPVLRLGAATLGAVLALAGVLAFGSFRTVEDIALAAPPATPIPAASTDSGPSSSPGAPSPSAASTGHAVPSASASPAVPAPTAAPMTWDLIPDVDLAEAVALPVGLRPSLSDARSDVESVWRDRCGGQVADIEPAGCVYGDETGSLTIALVGDSHAAQWFPAFETLATERGWRLVPYVKQSCPFIDIPVEHHLLKREYTECAAWRERAIELLADERPDIVVVAMSHRGIFPWLAEHRDVTRQGEAIGRSLLRLPGRVLVMVDTPRTSIDIPGCLAAHPDDIRPCAIQREPSFTDSMGVRERIAADIAEAGLLDLLPHVCPSLPCQVVRDGMIVYRDNHHLTATFSASLAPALAGALRPYVNAIEGALSPEGPG